MSRLPYLRRDQLASEGQALWDAVAGIRSEDIGIEGTELVRDDASLAGPFNAWVHAPEIGRPLAALTWTLLTGTSIGRRLTEIAILTVAARWRAEFVWLEHSQMARSYGVSEAVVDAIGSGDDPPFEASDERVVHAVASQLALAGRVDMDSYLAARELLGDSGVVELVTLCGCYMLHSLLVNAFDVPVPPGAVPRWSDGHPDGADRTAVQR